MAYSDFTVEILKKQFGLKFRAERLFGEAVPTAPSAWLVEALARGAEMGFSSEKSRSERLVTPVLMELTRLRPHTFSVYSGANLDVDIAAGLRGECDFIFSLSRIQDFVTAPIICIAEAKKQDLEQGTLQVTAQLLGARKLNEREGNSIETLYGCSTTGIEWRFLTLQGSEVTVDEVRYQLANLDALLGTLQAVVDRAVATAGMA